MSQAKQATILAVSEGWEDAYIKVEDSRNGDELAERVYYVRAPYFQKQEPIEETILRSSLAYGLIVPEKQDFPSLNAALEYVKNQYETQDEPLISFEKAVDVILDYAKEINHPLAHLAARRSAVRRSIEKAYPIAQGFILRLEIRLKGFFIGIQNFLLEIWDDISPFLAHLIGEAILFVVFLLLAYVIEVLLHLLFKEKVPLVLLNALHIAIDAVTGLGFIARAVARIITLIQERRRSQQ
jgi:hypothetical protein